MKGPQRRRGRPVEFVHHIDQTAVADLVTRRQRVDVADQLIGFAHVAADDAHKRFIDRAAFANFIIGI